PSLSAAGGGAGTCDPRLDHRPRARALLAARRADRDHRAGGADVHHLPRADRQAGVAVGRDQHRLRLVGGAAGWSPDPDRLDLAFARECGTPQAARRPLSSPPGNVRPDRNLALELVRVTEAAALAAARMVGRGDKEGADQAAVDAMRAVLDSIAMDGVVVIGEGEKDEAPMLYNGE